MKRVLGMGMTVVLVLLVASPAEAHMKKFASTIVITDADVFNNFVTYTITGKDKCGGRDIEVRNVDGDVLGIGTTPAANHSSKVGLPDVAPGGTYVGVVLKKVIKRSAEHRHVCKSATHQFTAAVPI